ncbi:MAG: hypothetical protein M9916_00065 [Crocinitomicaceae bacterium]|nr:hypothetical protein [Crocinitomicaceae bacterium]
MDKQKRVAIVEIGGSHDECILSQLNGLKEANAWIALCATKDILSKNSLFETAIDCFHEIEFPHTMLGDFFTMRNLNKWFKEQNITTIIANTAQGGHIRNLCVTSSKKTQFFGIIHTIKMLNGSFTQSIISRKIKNYFVLNDTLKKRVNPQKGSRVYSFYPLSYPRFNKSISKNNNEIWIGIIGGVESRRKDLNGFIKMAAQTPETVRFLFLGKSNPVSDEVKTFKALVEEHQLTNRIQLFEHFLNEVEFDAYLSQLDGIFPLVHPNTASAEEYFTRQISGAINIAFSYKIPMMIHEAYQDWEDFNQGVVFYNLTNFETQFQSFCSHLGQLKEDLKKVEKFSEEFQNSTFAKIVLGIK